jgi:hypothetical protein
MPRLRFTVRQMMVVVALVAAVMGLSIERHRRFARIAARHRAVMYEGASVVAGPRPGYRLTGSGWRHFKTYLKYARAARYPWLPVAPDPPEPEG